MKDLPKNSMKIIEVANSLPSKIFIQRNHLEFASFGDAFN